MAGESTLDRRATIDGRQPARHSTADNRRPGDNRRPTIDGRATIGLSAVECRMSLGCRLSHVASLILAFVAFSALAEPAYTNHAGNAIAGWPVALTAKQVTLAERTAIHDSQLTTNNLSTSQPFNSKHLPALDLPRIRAAAHRGGLRPAARAGGREAGDRRGGEGDGAFAQARGEGTLHEGGKRRLLHEVGGRAQELPRQAGQRGRDHPRRTKGSWICLLKEL